MTPGPVRAWRPARRRTRACDWVLLFCFAWLATALPLMPHQVPTLWLWGALSGACLVTTSWVLVHRGGRPRAIWSLLGCSALVGLASFVDFWRLSPVYLLSQCRSSADGELFLSLWRHIEFHWQWFPVTTIAMLLWILMPGWREIDQRSLPTQILPRLAHGACMFFCMEVAMRGVEALGIRVQGEMSADGFVCAMLCGMSLYHLLMQIKPFGGSQKWNRKVRTPH